MKQKRAFECCGISGHIENKLEDLFDVILNETDHFFALSKEVFKHEEEKYNFSYKYAIEADECEGNIFYSFSLVPTPDSLNEKTLESVANSSGVEKDEVDSYDVYFYGCYIQLCALKTDTDEIQDEILENFANIMQCVNTLRGFYLDKQYNAIGNDGWDLLDDFINGNNAINKALNRIKV